MNSILEITWLTFKSFIDSRSLSVQWIDEYDNYYLRAFDGYFSVSCVLNKSSDTDSITDFETNYKPNGNQSLSTTVTTQYELNNKDLKLARIKASVVAGSPNKAVATLKVPGTFGVDDGRYIAGGDGWVDTFDPDDYMTVECYDNDRVIAWALALGADSSATQPLNDSVVQGMGILPGPLNALGALPNYPLIKSYTDEDVPSDNQGWYTWPLSQGSTLAPIGEIEFEPIAGYGHIPSGFYIVISLIRPNQTIGTIRGNLFWGKKE